MITKIFRRIRVNKIKKKPTNTILRKQKYFIHSYIHLYIQKSVFSLMENNWCAQIMKIICWVLSDFYTRARFFAAEKFAWVRHLQHNQTVLK